MKYQVSSKQYGWLVSGELRQALWVLYSDWKVSPLVRVDVPSNQNI